MKRYTIVIASFIALLFFGCRDFLEVNPRGVLSETQVEGPEQLENFVTAAYAAMSSLGYGDTHNPWIQTVRSDDAYKGGGGLNDQVPWYEMEVFTLVTPNIGNNDGPWYRGYVGIGRTNTALRLLNATDPSVFANQDQRIAEMKFLRGWIYLGMKLRWKYVPIIDETTPADAVLVEEISNRPEGMTNDLPIWDWIIQNFEEAAALLPESQSERGRPTKYAAHALAAKALLFRAYEQDDRHQVININRETLGRALEHLDAITAADGALFDLQADFGDNFMVEFDNATKESLWEVQYSINDGTTDGRINRGNELNAPWWAPHFTCCDFNKVSHTMVNAFKTDATGLPDFNNYNNTEMTGNGYVSYFQEHQFDPRLSHTAGIPGYPWKYDNGLLFEEGGSRAPFQYGFFKSMKENVHPDCDCIFRPFFIMNSMNERVVRYSEVLLWKAEVYIQLDRINDALPLINRVRERASGSVQRLRKNDGNLWMDYKVATYQPGVNCNWTKEFAWQALMWENRLETAMEGRRFFDLLRWGQLEPTMNAYFAKERARFDWFNIARFTAGRDEYLPIPQQQMNWSKGSYRQNPGY